MKIELTGPVVAIAEVDLVKLREDIKKLPPYKAIRQSVIIRKNKLYEKDEDLISVLYGEVNWGTLFMILDRYPEKDVLEIGWFPVKYEGIPQVQKSKADFREGKFEFNVITKDGDDYMMLGQKTMTDPDAWFDAFLSTRFFDTLTKKWEIKIG